LLRFILYFVYVLRKPPPPYLYMLVDVYVFFFLVPSQTPLKYADLKQSQEKLKS